MGGTELRPGIVSTELLRNAREHPQYYRDPAVRTPCYYTIRTNTGRAIHDRDQPVNKDSLLIIKSVPDWCSNSASRLIWFVPS